MQAFNIKNNAELVLFALERGLISVNSEPLSVTQLRHPV
jgi:hypothetical protein